MISPPKIALACTGLGRVDRGFESFARDLFDTIKDSADITLFKGGGPPAPREMVVPNVPRQVSLALGLTRDWRQAYRWEQLSFAVGMLPSLMKGRYGIVHYTDGALATGLLRLRRLFRMRFAMIFGNGGAHTPETYARVDYIQLVSPVQHREALDYGLPRERLFMIPLGVDHRRFEPPAGLNRAELRHRHGVPGDAWVILAASAMNSSDKRLDWVIRETSLIRGRDVFLLMCGQRGPETTELERLAADLLPGRHAFTTVPAAQVPELYWLSDAFALGSLREGFGLAVVEAAFARLPLLVHDCEHFGWITGHEASVVDMTRMGALASRLEALRQGSELARELAESNRLAALRRFAWDVLRPQYLTMYEEVGGRPPPGSRSR